MTVLTFVTLYLKKSVKIQLSRGVRHLAGLRARARSNAKLRTARAPTRGCKNKIKPKTTPYCARV